MRGRARLRVFIIRSRAPPASRASVIITAPIPTPYAASTTVAAAGPLTAREAPTTDRNTGRVQPKDAIAYATPNKYIDGAPLLDRPPFSPALKLQPIWRPERITRPATVIAMPAPAPAHGTARTMLPSP